VANKKETEEGYQAPAEAEGNGEGSYEDFVKALEEKGVIADGDKIAREGLHMLEATTEQRAAAVHYIAAAGKAESIFKNEKIIAGISDQLARTAFPSQDNMFAFLDLFDWAIEFDYHPALVYCYEYVIALPSVGGQSRRELVEAVTTVNSQQRIQYGNNKRGAPFSRSKQPNDIALS
jgi:hypothetical protein